MKEYNKYLIKEQESKNNLLENVLDLENEWNEENKQENFYLSIDTQWIEEERKVFPIAFYLGDYNAQYDFEYDCFTLDCIERYLVGIDKKIIDLLKEDLKDYERGLPQCL